MILVNFLESWKSDEGDDEGEDDVDQDCVVFPLISRSPPSHLADTRMMHCWARQRFIDQFKPENKKIIRS